MSGIVRSHGGNDFVPQQTLGQLVGFGHFAQELNPGQLRLASRRVGGVAPAHPFKTAVEMKSKKSCRSDSDHCCVVS